MKKIYVKPIADIHTMFPVTMITSSCCDTYNNNVICGNNCKIWHMCLDRKFGNVCFDKKLKK